MVVRDITGSMIAYAAGVSNEVFRGYRSTHKYLTGYGDLRGSAYFYSRDEALRIIVAIALGRSAAVQLRDAFDVVADPAHPIQGAFTESGGGDSIVCRFRRPIQSLYGGVSILHFDATEAVRLAALRLDESLSRLAAERLQDARARRSSIAAE